MTINDDIRKQVRQRANFACEFCGVTETDAGSELTVDHYQPRAKGGDDSLENLLYCCPRCNQYKLDYWPTQPDDPLLWNPRRESASQHFLELDDGTLHPLTTVGAFTLKRLRLNRPPLVAYRLRKRQQAEEIRLLTRYREIVLLLERLNTQLSDLMEEQHQLLGEEWELLRLLLRHKEY
ncbi:MAG: HNH endonuclease [Chloroflexi bacterium]|nr:HNH endonuclease [Chloroflexota bacterium]